VAATLDAITSALSGDEGVVLLSDTTPARHDEAVTVLAAVAFLSSPPLLRRLSFSTYERARSFAERRPAVLSVVPFEDAEELRGRGGLRVVDPREAASHVGASPWAALARSFVGCAPEGVSDRLLALDELAELNSEACRLERLFPLALAIAESEDTADGWPAAASVLVRVPPALVEDDDSRDVTKEFLAANGSQVVGASRPLLESLDPTSDPDGALRAHLHDLLLAEDELDDVLLLDGSHAARVASGLDSSRHAPGSLRRLVELAEACRPDAPRPARIAAVHALIGSALRGGDAATPGSRSRLAVARVLGGDDVTPADLAELLRAAQGEVRADLAVLAGAVLQDAQVGAAGTVALASTLIDLDREAPGAVSQQVRLLARVLVWLQPNWWLAPVESAGETAQLLGQAMALLLDAAAISADCEARLRPHLFAALLHVLAGADHIADHQWLRLRPQLPETPQLAAELTNGLRPAADMLRDNEPVAAALLVQLVTDKDKRVPLAQAIVDVLDKQLEREDQDVLLCQRAEVVAAALVLDLHSEEWVTKVLAAEGLDVGALRAELGAPPGHVAKIAFEGGA
jgi:hypothetical protein